MKATIMTFNNRHEAGLKLARELLKFKGDDTVVLALPRGGVVLGAAVAKELGAPLGLVLVRKIGHPSFEEYAIGAVAEDEEPIYNELETANVDDKWLQRAEDSARKLMSERRAYYFSKDVKQPDIDGKTAILVDDGIATGLTMEAAVISTRNKGAKKIVVAVPVAPPDSVITLQSLADEVIVLDNPVTFKGAVGAHYREFSQVDDYEVREILSQTV